MPYSPSGGAVSKQLPFGMSNLPLDAKLMYDDTVNFTKRAFISTAEILEYFPEGSPFRNGSFEILLNTGGTISNGVITGGVETIWWFSGGTEDANLIQKYYTTLQVDDSLDIYQLRSEKGVANGYVPLDISNKIPLSFLPAGFQTYKGTYDASTNTPTLVDGVGTAGDTYRVTVAGTQNLGSGNITFSMGDDVIYNGTIWQRNPSGAGITLGMENGLSLVGQELSLALSSTSTVGALSSVDWNTFNGKQNSLGFTPENVLNKAADLLIPDNIKYPTTLAVSNALNTYVSKDNFEKIPFSASTGIINLDFTLNSRQSKFPNPDIRAYNVSGSIENEIIGFNEKITRSGANISTVELDYIAGDGYILLTNN